MRNRKKGPGRRWSPFPDYSSQPYTSRSCKTTDTWPETLRGIPVYSPAFASTH